MSTPPGPYYFAFVRESGLMVMPDTMLFRYFADYCRYNSYDSLILLRNIPLGFTMWAWYFGSVLPNP